MKYFKNIFYWLKNKLSNLNYFNRYKFLKHISGLCHRNLKKKFVYY